jgi:DnaJ-class molecular chaperone
MPRNFAHLGGLNAYEILGIESTATSAEIEAAYRAAIKRQHSDTGGVTRLAQLVNDAHDALVIVRCLASDAATSNGT